MTIQQRTQILQILYEELTRGTQTFDRDMLTQRMATSWDNIRHEVNYLEESGYLEVKRRQVGVRIFEVLRITAKGIDLVVMPPSPISEESKLWDAKLTNLKTERRAMEKHPQSLDVCIVCALPEEARAFLEVVQQQGEGVLEERISPRYHYSYRFATIKNDKDEPLSLHISWLPRYGPQEMTLHLSRVLEEYQPRIAIMTGICAGDPQRAQLGDLVVAERTFTYDNGKFTLDEYGRSVHEHDTMTYQLDANILQFLGLFDDWKLLIARLDRPLSSPEISLKQREVCCHIKAMASGSAVRADHPFEEVRAPVRGTVAIDMEGAAFGLVMSRHPLIPWLVVKGICDYADQDKNDAYHDYAALASALYALSFIRAYVTNERLS